MILSRLPDHIARREIRELTERLDWPDSCFEIVRPAHTRGPGNAVVVELEFDNLTEVFTAFGRKGVPAERVVGELTAELLPYLALDAPVGLHLADQLLLPMALGAGGCFRAVGLTNHTRTNIELIGALLPVEITIEERERDALITVEQCASKTRA